MKFINIIVLILAAMVSQLAAAQTQDTAQVVRTEPVIDRVAVQSQVCDQTAAAPQKKGVAGAILGGLGGAIVGSRFGKGHGRDALTVASAIGGAVLGDRIQNGDSQPQANCREVTTYKDKLTGYRVTFRYAGREYTQVLPRDPGPTVPVVVSITAQ